jgi:hypothetical protein
VTVRPFRLNLARYQGWSQPTTQGATPRTRLAASGVLELSSGSTRQLSPAVGDIASEGVGHLVGVRRYDGLVATRNQSRSPGRRATAEPSQWPILDRHSEELLVGIAPKGSERQSALGKGVIWSGGS